MNTNKIKAYAPQARREFIQAVTDKAGILGISQKEIKPVDFKGDVALIGGRDFPKRIGEQRKLLEKRIERDGFEQVMEAMAYTWFNRFMALRYMELHDYLDHGYRILSNRSGSDIPEILENAANVDLPGLDKEKAAELRMAGDKDNDLYRLLIITQCNALHRSMPFLFERINDETDLLLPDNLLHSNSPIRKMVKDIAEEDWREVEIIGWIYQFYISEKKDQVIGKVVKSEDIPAATQLFTPNWIVKYMVQNTLGRKWLATYPESPLRDKMEYYIEPAEQEPEVQAQLDAITPKELNPEEITFLDPACGSGHILVEAYEIYKEIYLERGYRTRDIPKLILEKNLYGLEIDERAAQMAGFALMMKARRDDRRILSREEPRELNIMALQGSQGLNADEIANILGAEKREKLVGGDTLFDDFDIQPSLEMRRESGLDRSDIIELINLFEHAKTFGSLIQIPDALMDKLAFISEAVMREDKAIFKEMLKPLESIVRQAEILGKKYDCLVTNPPYMGSKGMNSELRGYLKDNYTNTKSDLYTAFVERIMCSVNEAGAMGLMTPFTWMFLSSHEKLRIHLLGETTLTSLIRPEYHAFFDSAYVPICSYTSLFHSINNFKGVFIDLQKFYGTDIQAIKALEAIANPDCGWFYCASATDFKKIPGNPIVYWVDRHVIYAFSDFPRFEEMAPTRKGMVTARNEIYVRSWQEVSVNKAGFDKFKDRHEARVSGKKWFSYLKGGGYRKWFGNKNDVVNWENDGELLQNTKHPYEDRIWATNFNFDFIFKQNVNWGAVTSSNFSARISKGGELFDAGGSACFPKKLSMQAILGYLNSKVTRIMISALNPTLNFQAGNIANLPLSSNIDNAETVRIVDELTSYHKRDWDDFETSWDFTRLSLLQPTYQQPVLQFTYKHLRNHWKKVTLEIQQLEKENNRIFIDAYSLQDELAPDVPLKEITLTCNPHYRYSGDKTEEELEAQLQLDTMKELISYSMGCMMGRYSLDEPGLIYANSGNEGFDPSQYQTFPADEDGIVPVMDQDWFPDDAANRFAEFLKVSWTPETLNENLKFVADTLRPKSGESPVDTIRRYLSTGFFKDHLKTYKKRPIYWLFSSGKQKAFECLVYLHRYNESTLSRIRSAYVTPLQGKFNARIEFLNTEIESAAGGSVQKKLQKEKETLKKKQEELKKFDEELRHYADMRLKLDLDDGVKVNYGRFGNLLAERKAVTGEK